MIITRKILVFGGTTQGRQVSTFLSKLRIAHFYSTKLALSRVPSSSAICFSGAMDAGRIASFCRDKNIRCIIDASHPFAQLLHEEIAVASQWVGIPVIRFEREEIPSVNHRLVHYVSSYSQALVLFNQLGCIRLLAATGVNTVKTILTDPVAQSLQIWFRVLNRSDSIALAQNSGADKNHIIASDPPISAAHELAMLRKYGFDGVLSKNSGMSGGVQYKISACLGAGIPIVMVNRPALPANFELVYTLSELQQRLTSL